MAGARMVTVRQLAEVVVGDWLQWWFSFDLAI